MKPITEFNRLEQLPKTSTRINESCTFIWIGNHPNRKPELNRSSDALFHSIDIHPVYTLRRQHYTPSI